MASPDFDKGAADYQKLSEDVNKRIIREALAWIPQPTLNGRILDLACGGGVATQTIMETLESGGASSQEPEILGLDISNNMIQLYQATADANKWTRVSSKVQDCQNLQGLEDETFDLVVMSFGIMFMADAPACAREVRRVLKPGGHALFTTWKKNRLADLVARATKVVNKEAQSLPTRYGWDTKDKIISVLEQGGFDKKKIQVSTMSNSWTSDRETSDSAEGIVDALSTPFWNPLKDGTPESRGRWAAALESQLSQEEKETGAVDMIPWITVAQKGF